MEGQSGLLELSAISWVSAVEGPLSGVPLHSVGTFNHALLATTNHVFAALETVAEWVVG